MNISEHIRSLTATAEAELQPIFAKFDADAALWTERVLDAFHRFNLSESMFAGTTGYGYDDMGREALDNIYAELFGTEAALVRIGFVNGTHAIASALYGALEPGQTLLAAVGAPYDTLLGVVGITGNYHGSLKSYGIGYAQLESLPDGSPDLEGLAARLSNGDVGAVLIQRSRGYSTRPSLSLKQVEQLCGVIRSAAPSAKIILDNCYCEFVDAGLPGAAGPDLICGSLIKNPGGGLAPSGAYVAGRAELVERTAYRLTVPGIGGECGATLGQNRLLFQGLFMAPHTVAQSLKTAALCARLAQLTGLSASPTWDGKRVDIIQQIDLGSREAVIAFCQGIQAGSPVDSFAAPEPAPMPGYDCDVIMAAGNFIQGASIELSCDAPMRPPYTAYMQGGLSYQSGRLGVMLAFSRMEGR